MKKDDYQLMAGLQRLGFSWDQANQLRRISMTLRRWFTLECGTSNEAGATLSIEREDNGEGKPFRRVQYLGPGGVWVDRRTSIADREAGARRRLAQIMAPFRRRLVAFVQGDPRGCSLYILRRRDLKPGETLASVYTRGVAVY